MNDLKVRSSGKSVPGYDRCEEGMVKGVVIQLNTDRIKECEGEYMSVNAVRCR